MASIQSLGIGSGLLTTELVDKILAAERESTDLRLDARRSEVEAKISAFGTIRSKVDVLRSAAKALATTSSVLANRATSNDPDAVGARAGAGAASGTHGVEVLSLARAHTLASRRFDGAGSVVGTGTLEIRFGTTTLDVDGGYASFEPNPDHAAVSITIDESSSSLVGVRDAINRADAGVRASLVNDGQGYRLVLASTRTGAANGLEIAVTEGATSGLSALSFNATASTPGTHMSQTVAAADAELVVDGIAIARDSNTIADVIEGITFEALAVNAGSPALVRVDRDESGIAERLEAFVDAYNDVRALAQELTKFDTDSEQGSLLTGDATIRGIQSQLRRMLATTLAGSDSVRSLVDLGVTSDQSNGYFLTFDASRLADALARDPDAVAAVLATQKSASDSLVAVTAFGARTEPGTYPLEVTRLATRGVYVGDTTAATTDIVVDDDNDELALDVDGVGSGTIQLTHGTYADGDALAAELEARINGASALGSVSVDVEWNATEGRIEIRSRRYGSASSVAITTVDASTTATLGLALDDGEAGRGVDVAGRVNGIEGTGRGQTLTVPSGPVPATAGFAEGNAIAAFDTPPLSLDAGNASFSIRVDGALSGTVVLAEGDYASGTDLAAEIESRINADASLAAAGAAVDVTWDGSRSRFVVSSRRTGPDSSVALVEVPPGTSAALGFAAGQGGSGRAATRIDDPAGGLQIQVSGGAVGARGTVTVVRGAMDRMGRYLDDVLSFTGTFRGKTESLEEQLEKIEKERQSFDARMTALETRLRTQFAAVDALISQLNRTSDYLSQQLSALPLSQSQRE